jgi:outer membrane protein OmpA-like peptidoglycan-associated protein
MKRWMIAFAFLSAGCAPSILKIGEMPRESACLAIVPFETRYDLEASEDPVSPLLAERLLKQGARGVLGPHELSQLFVEAHDRLPPFVDPFWVRTIGNRVGVDTVIFGSFSKLPLTLSEKDRREKLLISIDAYVMDVKSGEIRWTFGTREMVLGIELPSKLRQISETMASEIAGGRAGSLGKANCWQAPTGGTEVERPMTAPPEATPKPVDVALTKEERAVLTMLMRPSGFPIDASLFEGREDRLTADGVRVLGRVKAALMAKESPKRIRIEAHVDSTKDSARDLSLTKRRAEMVKRYLTDLGVEGARLDAAGFGGGRPMVPNLSRKSRELNRRTVLIPVVPLRKP